MLRVGVTLLFYYILIVSCTNYEPNVMLCWKNTTLSACPSTVQLSWIKELPMDMVEGNSYSATYRLVSEASIDNNLCTHANLHSCVEPLFCDPLDSDPNLVTKTKAFINSPAVNGTCVFNSVFDKIKQGNFTMIAHVTFQYNHTTWDVAIGTNRVIGSAVPGSSMMAMLPWLIPVIVVPILIVIILVIILLLNRYRTKHLPYATLIPSSLHFFFEKARVENNYEIHNMNPIVYKMKITNNKSPEARLMYKLIEKLDFGGIGIDEAYAVVSPPLVQNFFNMRNILISRLASGPGSIFYSDDWKYRDGDQYLNELREYTLGFFHEKVKNFTWNKPEIESGQILAVVHGTDLSTAWKIVCGGFVALLKTDIGYYGRGLYFSSSALYTVPYFASKDQPAILICLVLPGNPCPIVEAPIGDNSIAGASIFKGYQSHYVATSKSGYPIANRISNTQIYDEIVISEEAQVVPIFLLSLNKASLEPMIVDYKRDLQSSSADGQSILDEGRLSSFSKLREAGSGSIFSLRGGDLKSTTDARNVSVFSKPEAGSGSLSESERTKSSDTLLGRSKLRDSNVTAIPAEVNINIIQ